MPPRDDGPDAPTPLWAVFAFTFLNSIGSAIAYNGLFFIAKHAYGFSDGERFGLALLYGLAYIPAAILVGPVTRRLQTRGILSPRGFLVVLMLFAGALCWVPWLVERFFVAPGADRPDWPIWLVVGLYSPMSGAMWPTIEAFLSGGRSGHALRSATGKFNVVWSAPLVLTMLAMGPFMTAEKALLVLNTLGCVHLGAAGLLFWFAARPGRHIHEDHEPHPPIYTQLLGLLRVLLPIAFLFNSTLSPYLPSALSRLGLEAKWETAAAATWLAARVAVFFIMERWHGWHGRWSTPLIGGALLAVSFATVVLAPIMLSASIALPVLLVGLAGFGSGVGVVYCAALYYAMEVGHAEVDAGGTHEALIGAGYAAGPACGLLAIGGVSLAIIPPKAFEVAMIGLVSVLAVGATTWALRRATRVS